MTPWISTLKTYVDPRIITVLFLGFSSGLPRLLVASTLGAWLSDSNIDRATIGVFAYVALPYSFNFIWAPFIDQIRLPYLTKWLGRRRSWMLFTQLMLMILLLAMGTINPAESKFHIAWLALLVAFFSASQDIIIDAYRTEFLDKGMYQEGAAVAVFGYRMGMLVAGAGALAMADISDVGWQITYMIMAAFMLVGMITVIIAGEPNTDYTPISYDSIRSWLKQAVAEPFTHFITHTNNAWVMLLFIALYRMSDGFLGFMTTPFMLDIGFSKTEIATIGKAYGLSATLLGAFVGGTLLHRMNFYRALMVFGICQLITNLSYVLLAHVGSEQWALMLAVSCDNFAGGMVTIATITLMMRLCDTRYTATQYALLSSLASLASIMLAGFSGVIAEEYSWSAMFYTSAALGIPALYVLQKLKHHPAIKNTE